jgi:hypothetical protein
MANVPIPTTPWNMEYVHKKDVFPGTIVFSRAGSSEILGEQVKTYYKTSVSSW